MIGGKVVAQYHVNPAVIGGARVRVGSTIYDGSVRAQLDRLHAQLISE
jgi:F-type H+-transporting ATPase subunit delta